MSRVDSQVGHDTSELFGELGRLSQRYSVPITVVLIPNREQLFGSGGYALQDTLVPVARSNGLDVFDARAAFDSVADKRTLLLPDQHFNALGNRLLFTALLCHLNATCARTPAFGLTQ